MRTLPVLAVFAATLVWTPPLRAQAPNTVANESTVTATVERIERSTRVVTVKGAHNDFLSVYVDPSVSAFDDLTVGDTVTVRHVETVDVRSKPNAALTEPRDTTAEAKAAGRVNVVQQQKAVVTLESIDSQGLSVTYRMANGTKAMRPVNDKRLLRGLRAGDRVEITLTQERTITIDRRR